MAAVERAAELSGQLLGDDPTLRLEEAWDRALRQAHEEDLAGVLPPSQEDCRRLAWMAKRAPAYPGPLRDQGLLAPEI